MEFWTPKGETKRVIILDDQPFRFWTHSLWALGVKGFDGPPICLDRNGTLSETHGSCPFCQLSAMHKDSKGAQGVDGMYPSYIGYVTVVDCGSLTHGPTGAKLSGFVSKKGVEYNYSRKLLPLKKGGNDKPGLLPKFNRLKEKRGGLVGVVLDLYRAGEKEERVGAEWEVVGKVDVSNITALKAAIRSMDGYQQTHSKLVDAIETASPFDYMTVFKPRTRAQLIQMTGIAGKLSATGFTPDAEQPKPGPPESEPPVPDDDIPF
jgi:hypothetical protein